MEEKMASELKDEHIWHFELKPLPSASSGSDGDIVVDFVRKTLRELLDFVVLTQDGQEAKVNGFKMQGKPGKNHNIFDDG